jgi:hypothetical protein
MISKKPGPDLVRAVIRLSETIIAKNSGARSPGVAA